MLIHQLWALCSFFYFDADIYNIDPLFRALFSNSFGFHQKFTRKVHIAEITKMYNTSSACAVESAVFKIWHELKLVVKIFKINKKKRLFGAVQLTRNQNTKLYPFCHFSNAFYKVLFWTELIKMKLLCFFFMFDVAKVKSKIEK